MTNEFTPAYRGGTGTPLVLLHGGTATWHVWSALLPALSASHDVLAPTYAGHKGGPPLTRPAEPGVLADSVERVMDAAGIETAHIAGNSLGGWVGAELVARGRARSAVLLSPAGAWTPGNIGRVRSFFVNSRRQVLAGRLALPLLMRSPAARRIGFRGVAVHGDRLSHAEAMLSLQGVLGADLDNLLGLIDHPVGAGQYQDPGIPVLLAWGEKDRLLRMDQYEIWKTALPFAEARVVPGVGHVPMYDDPALVARTILDWTEAAEARAST